MQIRSYLNNSTFAAIHKFRAGAQTPATSNKMPKNVCDIPPSLHRVGNPARFKRGIKQNQNQHKWRRRITSRQRVPGLVFVIAIRWTTFDGFGSNTKRRAEHRQRSRKKKIIRLFRVWGAYHGRISNGGSGAKHRGRRGRGDARRGTGAASSGHRP